MKIKIVLLVIAAVGVASLGAWLKYADAPPLTENQLRTESFGEINLAAPLWGSKGVVLVFVDTGKFPAKDLAQRVAKTNVTTAVIDIQQALHALNRDANICLDSHTLASATADFLKQLPNSSTNRVIVSGIGAGALAPFLNAQSQTENPALNLSIGFSVALPNDLLVCPPLLSSQQNQLNTLVAAPTPKYHWRSVWTDQPPTETAVFIRALGEVDTRIAAYDTPLDVLLIEEITAAMGQTQQAAAPMPVVEVPGAKTSDTLTLFYSGDGGWRDLDRTVADELVAQNYPVVGVDVLRYFWEHKTPEQAAADLSATMAYYRKKWGVKSFVLAGYSFGADILPPIYNRLQQQDQDSVKLLVLLALANEADFEIHVSGWLGHSEGEHALAPELVKLPKQKILCVYGQAEKADTACTALTNTDARVLELPGGHHFDQDYPKLTRQIIDVYRQQGIQ
jgi:type IV secretory pathway VirJ component